MTDLPPARVLDVDPHAYFRLPGFSSSLAKVLVARSPAHAKDAYDRRIEQFAAEDETDDETPSDKQQRLDRGSMLHALILRIGKRIDPIPEGLLSSNGAIGTKAAKDYVAAARKAGRIPVKEKTLEGLQNIASAIRLRIKSAGHDLDGTSEMAIEWHERTPSGPVQCRGMLDHVVIWGIDREGQRLGTMLPGAVIYDLKIVDDATPQRCERTAESLGYAIQAAAYTRALTALYPALGGRIEFRFLFCEWRRPFEIWDPITDGTFDALGERRWLRAVHAWGAGLASGKWPGYRSLERACIVASPWALAQEGFTPDV